VDVDDAARVAPRHGEHVAAGIGEVPGVEEQAHGGPRRSHQPVDLGLRLHHGPHVVVIREPHPAAGQVLGDLGQRLAELRPVTLRQAWPRGEGDAEPPVHAARLLGEHHGGRRQRRQETRVRLHRGDLLLHAAPQKVRAIPSGHEVEPVLL
jgi:hypothetical protein